MKRMILKFKYFGMIAEALNKEVEELDLDFEKVSEIESYFKTKLNDINFKIAVNHNIVNADHKLNNNDEVALLPPFAGG